MSGICPRPGYRFLAGPVALWLALLAGGCGGMGSSYPVSGKVLIAGQPVLGKAGVVWFKPDADRGNTSRLVPGGAIDSAGNYLLSTRGRPGAPPGWYKVVVVVIEPGGTEPGGTGVNDTHLGKAEYQSEQTTPLAVEVVRGPGPNAYDLDLK